LCTASASKSYSNCDTSLYWNCQHNLYLTSMNIPGRETVLTLQCRAFISYVPQSYQPITTSIGVVCSGRTSLHLAHVYSVLYCTLFYIKFFVT